ncbi:MAG: ADP-ribosylation factor-like protein [Promethearchaeota archaeon]
MKLNPQKNPQKIVLFGLNYAGKTSIIKTILYEFDAFAHLLPTTGVDRTEMDFFGKSLLIWDFGGQSVYRDDYLKQPIRYFQRIKYFYYVVDVQDVERVKESAEYFLKLVKLSTEYSDNFKIYIFFHKIDPNIKNKTRFEESENKFLAEVLPKIKEINSELTPTYFYTSIYNPVSVISAFSQPLLGNETIYQTLSDAIDSYCWNRDLEFGLLFVQNFNIGSYFSDPKIVPKISKKISRFLEELDDFEEISPFNIEPYRIFTNSFVISVGDNNFYFHFSVGINNLNIPEDPNEIFDSMEEFTYNLRKILQNSELIRSGELRNQEILTGINELERRYLFTEEDQLKGLEQTDKIRDIQRNMELELIENQIMEEEEKEQENKDEAEDSQIKD